MPALLPAAVGNGPCSPGAVSWELGDPVLLKDREHVVKGKTEGRYTSQSQSPFQKPSLYSEKITLYTACDLDLIFFPLTFRLKELHF